MSDLAQRLRLNATIPMVMEAADRIEALEKLYAESRQELMKWIRNDPADAEIERLHARIEALEADINILLNLLNPLHGELDKQSYDEKLSQNFDAPPDAEYNVNITAQMERDLTQAVLILESRRDALASKA